MYSQPDNLSIITMFNLYPKNNMNLSFSCSFSSGFTGYSNAFVWYLLTACQINNNPLVQFVTKAKLYSKVQLQLSLWVYMFYYVFICPNSEHRFKNLLLPMLEKKFYLNIIFWLKCMYWDAENNFFLDVFECGRDYLG